MSRTDQFPVTPGARYSASLSPVCARTKSCHATSRRSNDCSRFTLHLLLAGYRIRFTMSLVVILAALEGTPTGRSSVLRKRGWRAGDGPSLSLLLGMIRGTGTRAWPRCLGDGRHDRPPPAKPERFSRAPCSGAGRTVNRSRTRALLDLHGRARSEPGDRKADAKHVDQDFVGEDDGGTPIPEGGSIDNGITAKSASVWIVLLL